MKKISAVIVDTYSMNELSKYSILKTLELKFIDKIYTLSTQPIISGEVFFKINKIQNISQYNDIAINIIPYIIEESALIFQWDGFPINKESWHDSFLDWDYIGAPWSHFNDELTVGNGGFSLRSGKFLKASKRLSLSPASVPNEETAEDVLLCITHRKNLEINHAIRFAPNEVAKHFSYESPYVSHTFGFHGAFNLPKEIPELFLIQNINELILRMGKPNFYFLFIISCIKYKKKNLFNEFLRALKTNPSAAKSTSRFFKNTHLKTISDFLDE
jgi:hypothetical protein